VRGGSTVSGVSNASRPFATAPPPRSRSAFAHILGRRQPGVIDIPPSILTRADEVIE